MITLKRPTKEYESEAKAFKQEFLDHGESTINGSELLDQMDSYEEWLKSVTDNISSDTVNPSWVVTDTYFAFDEHDRIVGIIDLRHELNDFLRDFGNSGYSVRPSERRKGYATQMLHLIIRRAGEIGLDRLQLSVERSNEPSVKTIMKNGGIYERSFTFEGEEADVYRIDTTSVGPEIIALPREQWKGKPIPMITRSDSYYDFEIDPLDQEGCSIIIKRIPAEEEIVHTPEEYDFPDGLYQDHWEKAEAYGTVDDDGELKACIEVCPEEWSNRLMVTELWVAEELRGTGIGKRLMDKAKEVAQAQKRRAIILETQSCNTNAIGFYLHQGFEIIGFDTCCYTNNDIGRHEVRINLGYFLNRDGRRRD